MTTNPWDPRTGHPPGGDAGDEVVEPPEAATPSPPPPAPPAPEPTEPTSERAATGRAGGTRIAVVIAAIAAALVVVLAVVAGWLQSERDDLQDQLSERDAVARVAGSLTEALFSFDYRDLDASRAEVLRLATGNLEMEYREAFEGAVRAELLATEAVGVATVHDVYVGEIDDESASAIAVVDLVVTSSDGERSTFDNYVLLSLVRTTGGWRVDAVSTINSGVAPGAPFDPSEGADPPPTAPPTTATP